MVPMAKNESLVKVAAVDPFPLVRECSPLMEAVDAFVIDSRETHLQAQVNYKTLRMTIRRVTEHYEPTRKALELAKKELLAARDQIVEPIAAAAEVLNGKIGSYEQAELRRVDEQRRIAEEAAQKALLEDRLRRAAEADAAGELEKADAIMEAPAPEVLTVEPRAEVAKISGVSARTVWHAEVYNFEALVRYVAEQGSLVLNLVEPNLAVLNAMAREHKERFDLPGVRAASDIIRAVRA
jgi:uncharacterized membrane-anchored protein YhcB (DUF1043 family)